MKCNFNFLKLLLHKLDGRNPYASMGCLCQWHDGCPALSVGGCIQASDETAILLFLLFFYFGQSQTFSLKIIS